MAPTMPGHPSHSLGCTHWWIICINGWVSSRLIGQLLDIQSPYWSTLSELQCQQTFIFAAPWDQIIKCPAQNQDDEYRKQDQKAVNRRASILSRLGLGPIHGSNPISFKTHWTRQQICSKYTCYVWKWQIIYCFSLSQGEKIGQFK